MFSTFSSDVMQPRSGHTVGTVGGKVVVVGGYDGSCRFGDVWFYDEDETMSFVPVALCGDEFKGRAGHLMVRQGNTEMFLLSIHSLLFNLIALLPT